MGDYASCFVWRSFGTWPGRAEIDPHDITDLVEHDILNGLGLPMGAAGAVEFTRAESPILLALLFSTTIFGFTASDDLYVVPDHARCLLLTDHHDVVHVEFRHAEDVEPWVAKMASRGYLLPDELPDETFIRPDWMGENNR